MTTRISRAAIQNLIDDLLLPKDGTDATKAGQIYAGLLTQNMRDIDRLSMMLNGTADFIEQHIPKDVSAQIRHRVDCMMHEIEGKEKKGAIKSSIILN